MARNCTVIIIDTLRVLGGHKSARNYVKQRRRAVEVWVSTCGCALCESGIDLV